MVPKTAVLSAVACFLVGMVGCGEGGGVASGAAVSVYVGAPLCAGAKRELARAGGRAGDLRVRAVCLPEARAGAEGRDRLSLAVLGANARRATEDSTAVGYLEPSDPAATRFSRPILESAGIAWIDSDSGAAAMHRLLGSIEDADTTSLRESVRRALGE